MCLLHTLAITLSVLYFFFFNDTATTEIYTLSLHDALPISVSCACDEHDELVVSRRRLIAVRASHLDVGEARTLDRKSTRLNSSHSQISYAVFCLKKKTKEHLHDIRSSTSQHLFSQMADASY